MKAVCAEHRSAAAAVLLAVSCAAHAMSDRAYGSLPLTFERNQGQTALAADFLAHAAGYDVAVAPNVALLQSSHAASPIRVQLLGADAHARAAANARSGVANYFDGEEPAHWHAGIATYGRVEYRGVYPGVDVVYHGNRRQLDVDLVVAPGADARVIVFDYSGAMSLTLDAHGDLVLLTSAGNLVQHRPLAYQDIAGARRTIYASYLLDGHRVRLDVGAYDRGHPLVIDPALAYSTFPGNQAFDNAYAIAAGKDGTVYVAGLTYGRFKCAWGAGRSDGGNGDAFIAKLSRDGSHFDYITYFGGSAQDAAQGVAVNSKGEAFVTGYTRSKDFPTTRSAAQTHDAPPTVQSAFAARFDDLGGLRYSTLLGGSASDSGMGIAVDGRDSAYVTGSTSSADFPVTPGAFQTKLAGLQNAFVTKLNAGGSALQYSTFLGGDDYDFGYAITVNGNGNVFVTGTTYGVLGSTFPTTTGVVQGNYAGGGDAFVTELNTAGSALIYSTLLGGAGYDAGRGIALDTAGNVYVAGSTSSSTFPVTVGALQNALNGVEDGFVAKLSRDGTRLAYSTYFGGSGSDAVYGIAVDASGNALVTGFTQSTDLPLAGGALVTRNLSGHSAYVAALNPQGSQLLYSTYLGGSLGDSGYAIAADASGYGYVTGYTSSSDVPSNAKRAARRSARSAGQSAFVAKIDFGRAAAR